MKEVLGMAEPLATWDRRWQTTACEPKLSYRPQSKMFDSFKWPGRHVRTIRASNCQVSDSIHLAHTTVTHV